MATLLVWTFVYNLLIPVRPSIQFVSAEEKKSKSIENSNFEDGLKIDSKFSIQNATDLYDKTQVKDGTSSSLCETNDHTNENLYLLQVPIQQV